MLAYVSTFVKDPGVQTDSMFSPSAQCTEAANKARRFILMVRRSSQDISKSAFIPLCGALVRPHLEYGMSACSQNLTADINHRERTQRLATRLVTGMRHFPYEETEAAGPSFLAAATTSGWSDYRLQHVHGSFGYWSKLVFHPSHSTWPKGTTLQGTSRCEPPPKKRVGIFGEGCEIL